MKPIQILKTCEKNVYKFIGFSQENYPAFNLPKIHAMQRYNGLCDLII